ncbi:hypothetical protein [Fibrobacter sp.]|uniref:hypothetical protein n=1 Tax=Fibrobacter sp. TaxID=35828 RepID=UPI00388EC8A6
MRLTSNILFVCITAIAILACDNSSTEANSSAIDWNEIPQKCEAMIGDDDIHTLVYDVVFEDWSLHEFSVFGEDVTTITDTFIGLTESDFDFFCNKSKNNQDAKNVTCQDNKITETYNSNGMTALIYGVYLNISCEALLDGGTTAGKFFEAE